MAGQMGVCGTFAGPWLAEARGCPSTQPFKVWPRGLKLQAPIPKGFGSTPTAGICSIRSDGKMSTTRCDERWHRAHAIHRRTVHPYTACHNISSLLLERRDGRLAQRR
jgi:hypothetical protein